MSAKQERLILRGIPTEIMTRISRRHQPTTVEHLSITTAKVPETGSLSFDDLTPAMIALASDREIRRIAHECGLRAKCSERVFKDQELPGMETVYTITAPRRSRLPLVNGISRRRKIYKGGALDHVGAYRQALLKMVRERERDKKINPKPGKRVKI